MSDNLLSESVLNDKIATAIHDDVISIITRYHQFQANGDLKYVEKYKLDIFSNMLEVVPAFSYDHPEILAKFPHGLVTENAIFIPASVYEKTGGLKDDNEFFYKEENLSPVAFSLYLTEMIGHKYGVIFSDTDYKNILTTTFTNCNEHTVNAALSEYQSITGNTKPQFISNRDLAQLCEKLDISSFSIIKEWSSDNSFIDNILAKSETINVQEHPFNQLKSLIKPMAIEGVNPHTTSKEFKELYGNGYNHCVIPQVLATLDAMNEQLLKDNPDINTYINKLQDNLTPSLLALNDKHFSIAINNLKNSIKSHQQRELSNDLRINIGKAIVNYEEKGQHITLYQRELFINTFTDMDKFGYGYNEQFKNRLKLVRKDDNINTENSVSRPKIK